MIDIATRLRRYYVFYVFGFLAFVLVLWGLEHQGMPPRWIGYAFLCMTILLYATIGILARTANVAEYYVAGRRIPAFFNGMATGADWMSAASFIGLAGTLYHSGYQGLAYVMGWTGGYVLVALLLAPYLRRFGQYTIAEYLGARYGGNAARLVGVLATVVASFVYPECFTNRLIPPSCSSGCVFFQPTDNPAPFFAHPNPLSKSIPLRVMLKFLR